MCVPRHEMAFPGNTSQLVSICLFAVGSAQRRCQLLPTLRRSWQRRPMIVQMHNADPVPITEDELLASSSRWHSPPRFAEVYLHHADSWGLGACCLRGAPAARCAFARRAQPMLQPAARTQVLMTQDSGPESNTNIPGCCTNRHLAVTTEEMPAVWSAVLLCRVFLTWRHILKPSKGM